MRIKQRLGGIVSSEEHCACHMDTQLFMSSRIVVIVSSLASSNSSESTSFLRWSFAPALQAFSDTHQKLGSGTACFQKRPFRSLQTSVSLKYAAARSVTSSTASMASLRVWPVGSLPSVSTVNEIANGILIDHAAFAIPMAST